MKAAKHPHIWLRVIALYALGAVTGAVLTGTTVGFLGSLLEVGQRRSLALVGIAIIGIILALADFGVGGTRTPTFHRQTCPAWWRAFGHARTALLWGFDLGLGFTTIRLASLYWVMLLVVFAIASPGEGAALLVGYGFALPLNLSIGILLFKRYDHRDVPLRILRLAQPLRFALAALLLLWCVALLSVVFF